MKKQIKASIIVISLFFSLIGYTKDFNQIGEWSKKDIDQSKKYSEWMQKRFKSTGTLMGATAFYLGKFLGRHIVITNWHVCSTHALCSKNSVRFPQLGKSFKVDDILFTEKSIDMAFIQIKVPWSDERVLQELEHQFDWEHDWETDQPFFTIGNGAHLNKHKQMKYELDGNCRLASGEVKLIQDPDKLNTAASRVWSVATGCDASRNDSGSPLYDLRTGELKGVLWASARPRNLKLEDSSYFDALIFAQDPSIWTDLTYFVPANKIREVLEAEMKRRGFLDPSIKKLLREIIK